MRRCLAARLAEVVLVVVGGPVAVLNRVRTGRGAGVAALARHSCLARVECRFHLHLQKVVAVLRERFDRRLRPGLLRYVEIERVAVGLAVLL